MKLGVMVIVVPIELTSLFSVGVSQPPNLMKYDVVVLHMLLDVGSAPLNVLQLIVHPRVILHVEVHPLHSGVDPLNTGSVEPCGC